MANHQPQTYARRITTRFEITFSIASTRLERQVKNDFPNILRAAIETEAWKHFTDAEGKPFKTLVEWLHSTYPNGASMGQGKHAISYDEALKLTEAVSDVHRVLEHDSPSKHIREQNAEQRASSPV